MRLRMLLALPALVLATLVPAVTAGSADAAPVRAWDRLASCESGGRWHIATGNGYYGGLQFSASTWRGFGGTRYASSAHRASRISRSGSPSGSGPGRAGVPGRCARARSACASPTRQTPSCTARGGLRAGLFSP